MKHRNHIRNGILLALFLSGAATSALAQTSDASSAPRPDETEVITKPFSYESKTNSWGFTFDNDVLVPGSRDQDYTYGINFSISGNNARSHWLSAHTPLAHINQWIGAGKSTIIQNETKIEYGLLGFTPENIQNAYADHNDRPYASLLYVSSSVETYDFARDISWNSSLTIGLLGLGLVGELQKTVHEATDGEQPRGWSNQISEGGELTAKLNIARQSLIFQNNHGTEIKSTYQAAIGYVTEASWSISGRIGKIHSPWARFNPELVSYGEQSAQTKQTRLTERYLWAGLALKGRAYNAFLQGQFKQSNVEYDSNALRHGIIEAWLGYTVAHANGYRFTYALRGHSSEIKSGTGDRNVVWGGLSVSKRFSS